jgi:hypothetical protein
MTAAAAAAAELPAVADEGSGDDEATVATTAANKKPAPESRKMADKGKRETAKGKVCACLSSSHRGTGRF